MKKWYLFFALVLLAPVFLVAQVRESSVDMSQGSQPAFSVTVKGLALKEVESLATDYISKISSAKAKKDRKTKEIFGDNATFNKISENTIDVYALVEGKDEDAQVHFFFDMGGIYLSSRSHADKAKYANEWVAEFGRLSRVRVGELVVEAEEDSLKDLEKEQEKLAKGQSSLESEIQKLTEKLEQAKKDLEQNKKDQESKKSDVEKQKEVVNKAKSKLKDIN